MHSHAHKSFAGSAAEMSALAIPMYVTRFPPDGDQGGGGGGGAVGRNTEARGTGDSGASGLRNKAPLCRNVFTDEQE